MTCISPPELDDAVLLAYLDGTADKGVRAHLKVCAHCRERAQQLAAFENDLTARLYRAACPAPEKLGEYHLGLLSPLEESAIARHLAGCPHCSQEVAQLDAYLEDLDPSPAPTPIERVGERAGVLIARLVGGGGRGAIGLPGLAPALAVRGEPGDSRVYRAGDAQVVIGVEDDPDRPGQRSIVGMALGLAPGQVEAQLWQRGVCVASASVDTLGNFALSGVAPGCYDLILRGANEIQIHALDA